MSLQTCWWCCLFLTIPNFQSSPLPRSRSGILIIETSKFRFYSIPLKTAKTKLAAEAIISESPLEFMSQFFLQLLVRQQVEKILLLFLFLFLYPLRKTPLLLVVVDGDLQLLSSADSSFFYLTCRFWTCWWCCLFLTIPNFQSSPLPRSRSEILIIKTSKFRFYSIPLKTAKTKLATKGIISESSFEFMSQFFL